MRINGKKLRQRREELELSQAAVATSARLSERGYRDYETGANKEPHGSTVRGLAEALGVPLEDFRRDFLLDSLPPLAQHQADTGQLRVLGRSPAAVIGAVGRLDRDGQLAVAKAIDDEVLREALGESVGKSELEARGLKVGKGVLLNYQVEALAAAQDMPTFEQMVKEIRKQLKGRGK